MRLTAGFAANAAPGSRRAGRENEARSEFQSALTMAEDMGIEFAAAKARGYLQLPG